MLLCRTHSSFVLLLYLFERAEREVKKMKENLLFTLVQLPEPVYFSLFLIIGKNIKEKRLLLISLMAIQYLLLVHIFPYNVWFQLIYTFISFVDLKILYKEKTQVTDIFLFAVASVILVLISFLTYSTAMFTYKNYYISLIINRVLLFGLMFYARNTISRLYAEFCSLWNRHKNSNKIRSLTIRNISIIIFNLMFWLINLGMIFFLAYLK